MARAQIDVPALSLAAAILLSSGQARASDTFVLSFPEPLKLNFNFWGQGQIGLTGATTDGGSPGGVSLRAT